MHILITGGAGFIGFHLAHRLIKEGHTVVAIDNMNDYYDVQLKRDRVAQFHGVDSFRFVEMDLAHDEAMDALFAKEGFSHVVNLGGQAGVRHSILEPRSYVQANMVGFANVLEGCRHNNVEHLLYASSSSVYGLNTSMPFSPHEAVNHPVSLYAASKKANELMAHSYSHLYNLPTTGLRFFTVYGPWGRPDMAYFLFTKAILAGEPINVFNNGCMRRDFTYIDDIIEGVYRVILQKPKANPSWNANKPDPATSSAPYRIYNVGNNNTIELGHFIKIIEDYLGRKAVKNMMPMQDGDVKATYANVDDLMTDTGFKPRTTVEEGIAHFLNWYRAYYKL